jgi:Caspase domain
MPAPQLQDYALVVGIQRYGDSEFLEPLDGPKNDVRRFLEWLSSPAGGYVPETNVKPYVLLSDAEGRTPTAGEIVEAVKKLLALAPGDQRIGRRLYIFFAGHGVGPDLDDAGLLTVEATEDAPAYIEGRLYANLFRGRAVFDEVVLMMDCCRGFDGDLPASIFPIKRKRDAGGAAKVRRFYAYATGFGKVSREKEFDDEVYGIFSYALMAGLNGGAIDGEGRITGPSLERYIKKKMGEQRPDIRCDSELVIADGFPPATVSITVQAKVPHHRLAVLYGDGFKPVENAPQNEGEGRYRILLRIGKTYVFQLLDAGGAVLRQSGRAIEDAEEKIHVEL